MEDESFGESVSTLGAVRCGQRAPHRTVSENPDPHKSRIIVLSLLSKTHRNSICAFAIETILFQIGAPQLTANKRGFGFGRICAQPAGEMA